MDLPRDVTGPEGSLPIHQRVVDQAGVLFRVGEVGLVRRGEDLGTAVGAARDGRPVAILETDMEGVVEPESSGRSSKKMVVPGENPPDLARIAFRTPFEASQ